MKIDCITKYEEVIKDLNLDERFDNFIYKDSIDKFKIIQQKEGNYPAIITISGFLSEDVENWEKWKNSILIAFPGRQWYHLEWNTQKDPRTKKFTTDKPVLHKSPKKKSKLKRLALIPSLFLSNIGLYIEIPKYIINNWWHLSIRNSRHTGNILSEILMACNNKEFILVGHSLGARVIYNCLENFGKKEVQTNIKEVHLLGGAVNSREEKWKNSQNTVNEMIYNYYSKNDKILKWLYSFIMIDRYPIGLIEVNLPFVKNINASKYISGHTEYIPNFHIIKTKLRSNKDENTK